MFFQLRKEKQFCENKMVLESIIKIYIFPCSRAGKVYGESVLMIFLTTSIARRVNAFFLNMSRFRGEAKASEKNMNGLAN